MNINYELREKYRLEWENIVINQINSGRSKFEAQMWADECLEDKYNEDNEPEDSE